MINKKEAERIQRIFGSRPHPEPEWSNYYQKSIDVFYAKMREKGWIRGSKHPGALDAPDLGYLQAMRLKVAGYRDNTGIDPKAYRWRYFRSGAVYLDDLFTKAIPTLIKQIYATKNEDDDVWYDNGNDLILMPMTDKVELHFGNGRWGRKQDVIDSLKHKSTGKMFENEGYGYFLSEHLSEIKWS